jgi:insertion element IS1 protein InsB
VGGFAVCFRSFDECDCEVIGNVCNGRDEMAANACGQLAGRDAATGIRGRTGGDGTGRDVALSKKKSQKLWLWKAYSRYPGHLVGWHFGSRHHRSLGKLRQKLNGWHVDAWASDDYKAYDELPIEQHLQGKAHTYSLEQNNGAQRHWLARFRRKSIVVSKSIDMLNATMRLFAHYRVNGTLQPLISLIS